MFIERNRFPLLKYWVPAVVITSLFAFYHHLNNFKPVNNVVLESSIAVDRKAFESKIAAIPALTRSRRFRVAQGPLDIQVSLPEHWQKTTLAATDGRTRFTSSDLKSCVDLFQREDGMPLLEAAMESPMMWLRPGIPYLGKSLAQTSIDSKPGLVGHIRLRVIGKEMPADVYVSNALIVVDNRWSIVLRSCEGTADEVFYQIYKSLTIGII